MPRLRCTRFAIPCRPYGARRPIREEVIEMTKAFGIVLQAVVGYFALRFAYSVLAETLQSFAPTGR